MEGIKQIVLENDQLKVTIKCDGAEMISIKHKITQHEYLWNADPEFWPRHAPVLFPIVGRLKDGYFEYNKKQYSLPTHGFARDTCFKLLKQEADQAVFSLSSNAETLNTYPFSFEFQIKYQLESNQVSVSYITLNKDTKELYYSVGAHPAFNLDLTKQYSFKFNQLDSLYSLHDMDAMLIGEKTEFTKTEFNYENALFDESDALIFGVDSPKKQVVIMQEGKPYITLDYDDFKLIGIWSPPKKNAPFVCLEPWRGVSDFNSREDHKLEHKDFIEKLSPGAAQQFSYILTFE